jgi:pimeloyl-ACP methyl ester carboxylesterase
LIGGQRPYRSRQFQTIHAARHLNVREQNGDVGSCLKNCNRFIGVRCFDHIELGFFDEFIRPEHAEYLARSIPGAELILLPDVSHFAPLQRPEQFNRAMCAFLEMIAS